MKSIIGKILARFVPEMKEIEGLQAKTKYLEYQLQSLGSQFRSQQITDIPSEDLEKTQTKASFDYQWKLLNEGKSLADDALFLAKAPATVCEYTNLPKDWFEGKKVLDLGCGAGRFSYALLSMGAIVTSADQSSAGLEQTKALCSQFGLKHKTQKIDLLNWDEQESYDLVFCYGVVHHTGNTYKAIINASRKVATSGKLFLMIYGYPLDVEGYRELNTYEELRRATAHMSFEERVYHLRKLYPAERVHGYFDAISPKINDLLSYEEICDLLRKLGFHSFTRTYESRNHHLIADKA